MLQTYTKAKQIGCKLFDVVTGTWTYNPAGGNTGIPFQSKAAAAESPVVSIPINLERYNGQFGIKLKSINIPMRIATADLTGVVTAVLYQQNLGVPTNATPANITATSIPITISQTVTNNAADRLFVVTVTSPALENAGTSVVADENYQLILTIPCATTTALRLYDATAVYDCVEG